ncbi:MAG: hypothetical protein MK538_05040 [Planctomycetes bacterium]|nr:hypothetical protein [Planctomycetota bacterium]
MSEERPSLQQETTAWSIVGALLAVVGLYAILHGGVSLLGGLGHDRTAIERGADEPPSRDRLVLELCVGSVVLAGGLALRVRSRRQRKRVSESPQPEDKPTSDGRIADRVNIAIIILSILWIAFILL